MTRHARLPAALAATTGAASAEGWPDLPVGVKNGPAAAVSGGAPRAFGGSGNATPDAAPPVIFETVSRYNPEAGAWETLGTAGPVGLLGASAVTLAGGRTIEEERESRFASACGGLFSFVFW